MGIEQGLAARAGVGQEDAHLTVVELAQTATPLAGDPAGLLPLLGEGGTVQDEGRVGMPQFRADVAAQLLPDGAVVPAAGADEELQGSALLARLGGDGFGGLALQAGELAAQQGEGMRALFVAGEAREVAGRELLQAAGAGADGGRRKFGVLEQGLRIGVVEHVHGGLHKGVRRQDSRAISCRLE